MTTTTTCTVTLPGTGPVDVTVSEYGDGRPFLLLHGGGGPDTVTGFAELFAKTHEVRVIVPTHPGFGDTARPAALTSIPGLAALYVALIGQLELEDVTVIGNSIGGWIAAEMTLLASPRISGAVLVDAVGIEVPGHPIADFSPSPWTRSSRSASTTPNHSESTQLRCRPPPRPSPPATAPPWPPTPERR
jgi:pimeloyl-ACP methyl ester carboxylesterase